VAFLDPFKVIGALSDADHGACGLSLLYAG